MGRVSERVVLHCPLKSATASLGGFMRKHAVMRGSAQLDLRVSLHDDGVCDRDVAVVLYPIRSHEDQHPVYSIRWHATDREPFPEFFGALAIDAALAERDIVSLLLSGSYDPPFGFAAHALDASFGRRITHATARDVLAHIAAHVRHENVALR